MIYYLNLDENNYLLSISEIGGGVEADIDLANYDFSGIRLNAYKWESDSLIFDEERFNILEAERIAEEEKINNQLTQEDRIAELEAAINLLVYGNIKK